jgi:hypothetical protein
MTDGEHESGFDGNEHEYEVERFEAVEDLVVLARQALDVGADGIEVALERGLAVALVFGRGEILVGDQRGLGIDHQVPVLGQMDNDVGLRARAVVPVVALLDVVFLALAQAGGFEHPLEHQFAPVPLRLARPLERPRQVLRVLAQGLIQSISCRTCSASAVRSLPSWT